MNHAELLTRLLPPVSYDAGGQVITAELFAEGNALDEAMRNAEFILREADPRTTVTLFTEWERVAALPDEGSAGIVLSIDQRRTALIAKLTMHGGQSRKFFIDLASSLGFPGATIDEFRPMTCNDTCNDVLASEADRFAWRINLPASGGVFFATCNSDCNSALASWGNALVERAINKFRPAHTTPIFSYV